MRKFTNIQREHFRHLVLDCIVQRLTTQESFPYIKDKLGSEIESRSFQSCKGRAKARCKEESNTPTKRQIRLCS
jgi:hypothetical protein